MSSPGALRPGVTVGEENFKASAASALGLRAYLV
jgi:hypothetical protein